MTDPFVCEPMATRDITRGDGSREPADDPPGVCSEDSGFLVRAGFKNANSVVSVLPNMTAPSGLKRVDQDCVCLRYFAHQC